MAPMPIVVEYITNVHPDEYDEAVARLRYHDDPPEGLIMHSAAVTSEGEMRVLDIWESRDAHDRFLEARGCPALYMVTGDQRVARSGRTSLLHSLVQPSR
jgi:hypothetical protein